MKIVDIFESVICSRCCGTGEYSYNQRMGRTCLKCLGATKTLTKRGHAAYGYYLAARQIKPSEVAIGQRVVFFDGTRTVNEISIKDDGDYIFRTKKCDYHMPPTTTSIRRMAKENELEEVFLPFQSHLTKTGRIAKKFVPLYENDKAAQAFMPNK
ncbi:hypothetical protein QTV49_000515 [Vibrio vulnificus]|nr:hypothetical protein [Vibrio vulnificus]